MKSISWTILSVLAEVLINLTSGWLGIVLITPSFVGVSLNDYLRLLTINLPPAIISLTIVIFLREKIKNYEH